MSERSIARTLLFTIPLVLVMEPKLFRHCRPTRAPRGDCGLPGVEVSRGRAASTRQRDKVVAELNQPAVAAEGIVYGIAADIVENNVP